MPVYLLAYHGVRVPKSDDDEAEMARAWKDWMLGLGASLEGSNNPIADTRTINAVGKVIDGGGSNPVMGLSFITADDFNAAIQMAQGCPHLKAGGSVEVAEITPRRQP